jgi:hypothetical protein
MFSGNLETLGTIEQEANAHELSMYKTQFSQTNISNAFNSVEVPNR